MLLQNYHFKRRRQTAINLLWYKKYKAFKLFEMLLSLSRKRWSKWCFFRWWMNFKTPSNCRVMHLTNCKKYLVRISCNLLLYIANTLTIKWMWWWRIMLVICGNTLQNDSLFSFIINYFLSFIREPCAACHGMALVSHWRFRRMSTSADLLKFKMYY